jgi:hypothetical protein
VRINITVERLGVTAWYLKKSMVNELNLVGGLEELL